GQPRPSRGHPCARQGGALPLPYPHAPGGKRALWRAFSFFTPCFPARQKTPFSWHFLGKNRSPASPTPARAPRAATPPRRRAWLRIFVVRCSLPCDPPVGGHSCNGGMIPRFHRAVCD